MPIIHMAQSYEHAVASGKGEVVWMALSNVEVAA